MLAGLLLVGGLTALGSIIFFTRSDKVKVTIELTDVDLSDKSLTFFLDEKPIAAEALAHPIELKPGEHVLVVKRGKEIVKRVLLTVAGGRSPGLKYKDITPPPEGPRGRLKVHPTTLRRRGPSGSGARYRSRLPTSEWASRVRVNSRRLTSRSSPSAWPTTIV